MITGKTLETLAYFYTNTDRDTLEDAGIIEKGPSGDTGWKRFNHNFDIFILKLSDEKQEALACLVNKYFRAVGRSPTPNTTLDEQERGA